MMLPMEDLRDKRSSGSSSKLQNVNGGRLKTGSTNRDVYFNVNLNELDAYTQQVLEDERSRRRTWCRRLVALAVLHLIVMACVAFSGATAHFGFLKKFSFSHDGDDVSTEGDNDTKPELITCEKQLNDGFTFQHLVDLIKEHEDPLKDRLCRPEADVCVWQNPTQPEARGISQGWASEFQHNKEMIDAAAASGQPLDVVLVGDSFVEHMEGKELGRKRDELQRDEEVFEQLFSKHDGKIDGLALGIGGDRCANLLYRLTHGELKQSFAPKVWWIVIGTVDWEFGSTAQAIVAGIIEIVKAIREVHPDTQIVINSLLPREIDNQSIQHINQLLACYVDSVRIAEKEEELKQELTLVDEHTGKVALDETVVKALEQNNYQKLHFFNATDIFSIEETSGEYEVNQDLMLPAGADEVDNPNAHGEFLWGDKIVETVLRLTAGQGDDGQNRRRLGARQQQKQPFEK